MKKIFKQNRLTNWIVSNFPENYKQMDYVEPFVTPLFFLKEQSITETLNNPDISIVNVLRALKDEPEDFINKLKTTTCSDNVFKRELKRTDKLQMDYFQQAISEYIILQMSKNCNKKNFEEQNWKEAIEDLHSVSDRLKNTFILNQKAIDVINFFDTKNSLIYCNPPKNFTTDETIALSEFLCRAQGKVILTAEYSALYNRLFANWKLSKNKNECLWKNY